MKWRIFGRNFLTTLLFCGAAFAKDLSPSEFDSWKKAQTHLVILDVRTPDEYKSGFIEGAVNIDFYAKDFKERLASLDKTETYFVYCRSGHRSGETVKILEAQGFAKVNNLAGGLIKWKNENKPLVREAGKKENSESAK